MPLFSIRLRRTLEQTAEIVVQTQTEEGARERALALFTNHEDNDVMWFEDSIVDGPTIDRVEVFKES